MLNYASSRSGISFQYQCKNIFAEALPIEVKFGNLKINKGEDNKNNKERKYTVKKSGETNNTKLKTKWKNGFQSWIFNK